MSHPQGAPTTNPCYQSVPTSAPNQVAIEQPAMQFLLPLVGQDMLLVKQKKEMLQIFSAWESNNRYEIYDRQGRSILYAVEDTPDLFSQCCLGQNRPFCIRVIDANKQQVIEHTVDINLKMFKKCFFNQ